jgi:NAD(P)-dependent dehydrogenase (short-subunit alcohol dehydrogenase family)
MKLLDGKVAIVTGAGRGVGRAEAMMLAKHGAKVVVNDLGVTKDGETEYESPAQQVVDEIVALGGQAVANLGDVANWEQAAAMVQQAVDTFGGLDILVNNAGILRDRMLWNMTEEDFDLVVNVNLKGSFAMLHHAAVYWRNQSKAGKSVAARVINTPSSVGMFGNIGQVNYGSAKAGVANMTVMAALELKRLGVTVNAVCPRAESRMTAGLVERTAEETARRSPDYVAALVTWLASDQASGVSGRVFEASGEGYAVLEGARHGAITEAQLDGVENMGDAIRGIVKNSQTPVHYNRGQFWDL